MLCYGTVGEPAIKSSSGISEKSLEYITLMLWLCLKQKSFLVLWVFFNQLGYTTSTIVDPVGRVGGIWLIWDPTQVSVSAHIANSQLIQAIVKRENFEEWVLAAVYASPNPNIRQNLWNDLENISSSMIRPWLIAGDFNDIMGQTERRSYSQNNQNYRCKKFSDNVNHCGLMDIGCSGPKFTWSNNRQGMANTMERLDRALCNAEWRTAFPKGAARNIPRTYSDHSPIMVHTEGITKLSPVNRPFHFEAAWLSHRTYKDIVKSSWNHSSFIQDNLFSVASNSLTWNKVVFGNIFKRKRWLYLVLREFKKLKFLPLIFLITFFDLKRTSLFNITKLCFKRKFFGFKNLEPIG
ncbi:hypothetical protein ACSBR1_032183 [Camellia fascicularis]